MKCSSLFLIIGDATLQCWLKVEIEGRAECLVQSGRGVKSAGLDLRSTAHRGRPTRGQPPTQVISIIISNSWHRDSSHTTLPQKNLMVLFRLAIRRAHFLLRLRRAVQLNFWLKLGFCPNRHDTSSLDVSHRFPPFLDVSQDFLTFLAVSHRLSSFLTFSHSFFSHCFSPWAHVLLVLLVWWALGSGGPVDLVGLWVWWVLWGND